MKKLMILIFVVSAFYCTGFGQVVFSSDSIPVINGKVVFRVNFETNLRKNIERERIKSFFNTTLNPYQGNFIVESDSLMVCNVIDYININSNLLSTFAMYMTYNIALEYRDNSCTVLIRNIRFMEKEYFEKKEEAKAYTTRKLYMPEFTAEEIMIEGKYKLILINKASQKVTEASIKRINEIFNELEISFTRKIKPNQNNR